MSEQRLIDELRARAAEDARRFQADYPGQQPNSLWIENSYTAALPLARDAAGASGNEGVHPELMDVYRQEIGRLVGGVRGEDNESDRDAGAELVQQPTPGEH
ncbi:MAG TPA: hypothetical protein VGF69_07205 [Thermoanaerobaculia bacterium]|jgi:hypothetical protein